MPTVSAPTSRAIRATTGCGAGAGAAALAGGDEHHVAPAQCVLELVVALLGGAAADLGLRAGAETLRQLAADVDLRLRVRHLQLLDVGVDRDELDLRDAGVHHPVDRVQAGAADADDADQRDVRRGLAARHAVQPRRRLGKRVALRFGRLVRARVLDRERARRRGRGGGRRWWWRGRGRGRGDGRRCRDGRRRGGQDVLGGLLPGRDVLDRALVLRFFVNRSRLGLGAFGLALCCLGRAEELRERALTH